MMNKKSLRLALAAVFLLGSMGVGLAEVIDETEGDQYLDVIDVPPGGGDCICPMIWAPVICGFGDSARYYSNACFAGCHGATDCRRIVINRP